MTKIVEDREVLRISTVGTVMMIAGDPQGHCGDMTRQAIAVADCALELQTCLSCYGKVPRTEVDSAFAIGLDTGEVAMTVMPGSVPS